MARDFKMHRAGPARHAITPLGGRPNRAAGQARLVGRDGPQPPEKGASSRPVEEIGGPGGPEPTRYGDWERNGICYDF
jgi:hypothetical protein